MKSMPRVLDNFELVNHLRAACQGWSVALRLRQACGGDGAAGRVLAGAPAAALAQVQRWTGELRRGEPLVLNNSAQQPSARLQEALRLLQALTAELLAAADALQVLLQKSFAVLDRQDAVRLVAGLAQQAFRDLYLLRAKLACARTHGQRLVLEQLRRERGPLRRRLAQVRCLRRALTCTVVPGDSWAGVVLRLSAAAVPGGLRLQAVDLRCLQAQVMQHPSPVALGIDSKDLGAWRERNLNAYAAAAWQALGLSLEDALAWQPWQPAEANEWHSRDFRPADAFAWQTHGFAATDAAVFRAFGVPSPEQARVQREVLGELDHFVAWCRVGIDPAEMVGWRLAGAEHPAQVAALRAAGAHPVPYQVVSIGGRIQVCAKVSV